MLRRDLLKMLAMLSVADPTSLFSVAVPPGPTTIHLVFHGFFFIEIQDESVVVASPKYQPHTFGYWDHGTRTFQSPKYGDDFRDRLKDGGTKIFPGDVLHFNRNAIFSKPVINPKEPASGAYGFLLILPFPKAIQGVRNGGKISDFQLDGKIGKSIANNCTGRLSVAAKLEYDVKADPAFTARNYYAEHCCPGGDPEVNKMFDAARTAFGNQFDTHIRSKITNPPSTPKPTDDEKILREISVTNNPCEGINCKKVVHTANCPLFGVQP